MSARHAVPSLAQLRAGSVPAAAVRRFKPGASTADDRGVSVNGLAAAARQLARTDSHPGRRPTAARPRRTRGPLALPAAVVSALVAIALTVMLSVAGGAQATQTPSAAALMRLALTDAIARGSVHEVETQTSSKVAGGLSGDIGTHNGRQDITRSGGQLAHVLVIGSTAYVSGNQAALLHYFGFPAAIAGKIGTRWVSVPSSNSGYAVITAGVTLASAMQELAIPGQLTEKSAGIVDGQSVTAIHSKAVRTGTKSVTVSVTMYVTRTLTPLPVRVAFSYSNGATTSVQFSGWNERLALKAPTNVIPVTSLH